MGEMRASVYNWDPFINNLDLGLSSSSSILNSSAISVVRSWRIQQCPMTQHLSKANFDKKWVLLSGSDGSATIDYFGSVVEPCEVFVKMYLNCVAL
ncbi:hypothetical protein WN943_014479 [Citrus x changshan-huyou]